jgi:hypothetical protein
LAASNIVVELEDFGEALDQLPTNWFDHGMRSPIVGSVAQAMRIRPPTSTGTVVPGASRAIRKARVIPL